LPRSGKSGIHNHQVSEYGFRTRHFMAIRNDENQSYTPARAHFLAAKCGIT
jgi:hypothetical protein